MDAVCILRSDQEAKLIFDDMRREILRLLAKEALTANKLSKILGLSAPTIGHHLQVLKKSGLIQITGREAESHGIVQKFYRATAQAYILETAKLSPMVKRYFMPARIERTRGMLAALSLNAETMYRPTSEIVESFTQELASHILEAAERSRGPSKETDPECVMCEIYKQALRNLINFKPSMFPSIPESETAKINRQVTYRNRNTRPAV